MHDISGHARGGKILYYSFFYLLPNLQLYYAQRVSVKIKINILLAIAKFHTGRQINCKK